jgi:hypothetical protein
MLPQRNRIGAKMQRFRRHVRWDRAVIGWLLGMLCPKLNPRRLDRYADWKDLKLSRLRWKDLRQLANWTPRLTARPPRSWMGKVRQFHLMRFWIPLRS